MVMCLSVVVSLRTCPLLITPRKESQAIDNVKSVRPARGDPQLLEGVSRSLREGCDRTLVLGVYAHVRVRPGRRPAPREQPGTRVGARCHPTHYAASGSQCSRSTVLAFANRTSTSAWQARGAHQHPSTNPRSSSRVANNAAFSRS